VPADGDYKRDQGNLRDGFDTNCQGPEGSLTITGRNWNGDWVSAESLGKNSKNRSID